MTNKLREVSVEEVTDEWKKQASELSETYEIEKPKPMTNKLREMKRKIIIAVVLVFTAWIVSPFVDLRITLLIFIVGLAFALQALNNKTE